MKEPMSFDRFERLAKDVEKADDNLTNVLRQSQLYHHNLEKESYPYIACWNIRELYMVFCLANFRRLNMNSHENFPMDFLDVGCGTGRVVRLAKLFGLKAAGLEYHEPYVKLGRVEYELSDEELIVGNAFDLSEEFIQKFAMIYTYMPIHVHSRMTELHFSLYKKSRYHTTILEMLPSYYPMNRFHKDDTIKRIFPEFSEEYHRFRFVRKEFESNGQ